MFNVFFKRYTVLSRAEYPGNEVLNVFFKIHGSRFNTVVKIVRGKPNFGLFCIF